MPATKTPTKKTPTTKTPTTKRATTPKPPRGTVALNGLELSLDQAEKALDGLRRDLSTGGRALVKDLETAIKRARTDLRRTRKAIERDLDTLGGSVKKTAK